MVNNCSRLLYTFLFRTVRQLWIVEYNVVTLKFQDNYGVALVNKYKNKFLSPYEDGKSTRLASLLST